MRLHAPTSAHGIGAGQRNGRELGREWRGGGDDVHHRDLHWRRAGSEEEESEIGGYRVGAPMLVAKKERALKRVVKHRDVPLPQPVKTDCAEGMDKRPEEGLDEVVDVDGGDIGNSGAEFLAGLPGRRKWNDEIEEKRSAMDGRSNEDEEEVSLVPAPRNIGAL